MLDSEHGDLKNQLHPQAEIKKRITAYKTD